MNQRLVVKAATTIVSFPTNLICSLTPIASHLQIQLPTYARANLIDYTGQCGAVREILQMPLNKSAWIQLISNGESPKQFSLLRDLKEKSSLTKTVAQGLD